MGGNCITALNLSNITFTQNNIDIVFKMLVSNDTALKELFDNYIEKEYKNEKNERLNYVDIGEIARYIINKLKSGQTENFNIFFNKVENILSSCDAEVENLIVVGLFEDIQNIGGWEEVNYYVSFDKWLGPLSKSRWNKLIDFWEGEDWRTGSNVK